MDKLGCLRWLQCTLWGRRAHAAPLVQRYLWCLQRQPWFVIHYILLRGHPALLVVLGWLGQLQHRVWNRIAHPRAIVLGRQLRHVQHWPCDRNARMRRWHSGSVDTVGILVRLQHGMRCR